MEYGIIANECAVRLENIGYHLHAQDRDYIDEVTLMILSDHVDNNLTEEELIELVMAEGRTFLKKNHELDLIIQSLRYRGYHLKLGKRVFRKTRWIIKGFPEGYRTLADAKAEIDKWGIETSDDFLDTEKVL
ncbi:MAG TPA: hypothetical protein VLN47_01550 [Clostridiaceae bacterium]|nr:hypothetical protein [Clostridiaceae bacterium]